MANWPSRVDYRLPPSAADDMRVLLDKLDNVPTLIRSLNQKQPMTALQDLLETMSQEVQISSADLGRIFNSLENIRDLSEDLRSLDEGILRLSKALDEDLSERLISRKLEIVDALRLYGDENSFTITLKAQRLTYSRERLLHDSDMITDARPVFNKSGSEILEYIITHTLMVSSTVDGAFQRRYLSLDNADVLNLRDACERAILKAKTLKAALETTSTPTVIVRDDAI